MNQDLQCYNNMGAAILCCKQQRQESKLVQTKRSYKSVDNTLMTSQIDEKSYEYYPTKYLGRGILGTTIQKKILLEKKPKAALKIVKINEIKIFSKFLFNQNPFMIQQLSSNDLFVKVQRYKQNKQNGKMYICMELMKEGDLYFQMSKPKSILLSQNFTYIMSLVIISLQELHSRKIIYGRLKPQNIMITRQGGIKFTDYIFSIHDLEYSFYIGAAEYAAPQIFGLHQFGIQQETNNKYDKQIDIWAFGILMYQLTYRVPPFHSKSVEGIIQQIKKETSKLVSYSSKQQNVKSDKILQQASSFDSQDIWLNKPMQQVSQQFKDLVQKCLVVDPASRIRLDEVKRHPFFENIKWKLSENKIYSSYKKDEDKNKIIFRSYLDPLQQPKRVIFKKMASQ